MPIHIDTIETELEIVAPPDEPREPATSGAAPAAARISADRMRRAIANALEEELQEYLRIRG